MTAIDVTTIDAPALRRAFATAEAWLARNRDAINAINVYPVPDGDTGTNMLLTLRAALEAGRAEPAAPVSAYLQAVARGALLGARGNSGVILSQMLRGLASALDGVEVVDIDGVCRALTGAADTAYAAVSVPVEGTMLTVMREAAEATAAARAGGVATLEELLHVAEDAAERSVERTPELMPLLRDAGVVDAGGMGVAVILAGLRMGYLETPLPEAPEVPAAAVELTAVEHLGHGYCTEFLLERRVSEGQLVPLDRIAIQHALETAGGESVLVVGDPEALHIHVHLEDPGPAFSIGVAAGELRKVKVDNMQFQHEAWAAAQRALPRVGVVAVAPGAGIAAAFRELGAVPLVFPDGRKPSASEFLQAARTAGSDHVFLLPNDKDAVMAAETAAREAPEFVSVIPTRSLVAGIAAAVGYVAGASADDLRGAMLAAAANARCVEVTRAARAATLDGIGVALNEPIALVDGRLVAAAASVEDALVAGLEYALTPGSELITVYLGADAPDGSAALAERLAQRFPELAVETVEGGQPHYPYVAGVE